MQKSEKFKLILGVLLFVLGTMMNIFVNISESNDVAEYRQTNRELQQNILTCSIAINQNLENDSSGLRLKINSSNPNVESQESIYKEQERLSKICGEKYGINFENPSPKEIHGSFTAGESREFSFKVKEQFSYQNYEIDLLNSILSALGSSLTMIGSIFLALLGTKISGIFRKED